MWIIREPKKAALWNKRHFEEKNGECAACLKYSVLIFVEKIYKMQHLECSGTPIPYIGRTVLKGYLYCGKYGLPTNNNRPGLCLTLAHWSKWALVQNRTTFIMLMNVVSHIEYQCFAIFSNGLFVFRVCIKGFLRNGTQTNTRNSTYNIFSHSVI